MLPGVCEITLGSFAVVIAGLHCISQILLFNLALSHNCDFFLLFTKKNLSLPHNHAKVENVIMRAEYMHRPQAHEVPTTRMFLGEEESYIFRISTLTTLLYVRQDHYLSGTPFPIKIRN